MKPSALIAAALITVGSASAVPTKSADIPTSVHVYVQDQGYEDIAYLTSTGLGYQLFYENINQDLVLPEPGVFTVQVIDGTLSSKGNQVNIQLIPQNGTCTASSGHIECSSNNTSATTFTAKKQFNSGFFQRDSWYILNDWSLLDAHDDDIRDGYLRVMTKQTERGRRASLYLVSA